MIIYQHCISSLVFKPLKNKVFKLQCFERIIGKLCETNTSIYKKSELFKFLRDDVERSNKFLKYSFLHKNQSIFAGPYQFLKFNIVATIGKVHRGPREWPPVLSTGPVRSIPFRAEWTRFFRIAAFPSAFCLLFDASRVAQGKESACTAGDTGSSLDWGRCPGEGNGNPLQYSCLENPVGRGAWRAAAHAISRVGNDLVTKPLPLLLFDDLFSGSLPQRNMSRFSSCLTSLKKNNPWLSSGNTNLGSRSQEPNWSVSGAEQLGLTVLLTEGQSQRAPPALCRGCGRSLCFGLLPMFQSMFPSTWLDFCNMLMAVRLPCFWTHCIFWLLNDVARWNCITSCFSEDCST